MSLRRQIFWLLISSVVVTTAAVSLHYYLYIERQKVHRANDDMRHELSGTTTINMLAEDLEKLAYDYSFWDELVNFTRNHDTAWAIENIAGSVSSYDLDFGWIYDKQKTQVFRFTKDSVTDLESPMPVTFFEKIFAKADSGSKTVHFFTTRSNEVIEIIGSSIHFSNDPNHLKPAEGYLFFGKRLDKTTISKLENLSVSQITIKPTGSVTSITNADQNSPSRHLSKYESLIVRPLNNWEDKPVAEFTFKFNDKYQANEDRLNVFTMITYISLVIILFLIFYIWVIRKISVPLLQFRKALDNENIESIKQLLNAKTEFGRIARIMQGFFQQKKEILDEVEEKRITQKILRESEDRFRTLSDSAFEGIVVHINGRILDVNDTILEMTGYRIEEITWKYFDNFLVAPGYEQQASGCVEAISPNIYEFMALRKDGSTFPVEARTKLISFKGKPAKVTTILDISERVQNEEEVRILSRAVESNPASIIITNNNGIVEYVNPKFCETTGYSKDEIIGRNPSILKGGMHSQEFYKKMWDTILGGNEWHGEICNRKKNGELFWEQASISPIRNNEKVTHFVAIKEDITEKRRITEELRRKNTILTDSINYAKKIQESVMPEDEELRCMFNGYFTLYLPRDIVSGDFLWMKHIKNILYIVVADCTGHGVPGALMSMLGISLLNERINKSRLDPPNEILKFLRNKIKQAMHQKGRISEQKEGMDISLCVIDLESLRLQFAGAYQSISIIREGEMINLPGDRQPIGVHYDEKDFSKKTFDLQTGDILYIYSDGFATQIGGKREKKIGTKRFRQLLMDASKLQMEKQDKFFRNKLDEWRGDWEQIDDITITGIKF